MKSDVGFRPVRVEVVLVPGTSGIQILGLPDQVIKESSKRIISALRHQNFRVPPGKQALVNLYPHDLKKSSQGLDLAIALGILLESEQVKMEGQNWEDTFVYGSLTLKGEVQAPKDLGFLNYESFDKKVLTGDFDGPHRFTIEKVTELSTVSELEFLEPNFESFQCTEHEVKSTMFFSEKMARLMSVIATGEHPLLIAGYAGCGKSTMVENLATILNLPDEKEFRVSQKYWKLTGRELRARPIVQPHHSATPASMTGGGRPLKFGEISLAHGGALILDELLEFHPLVQSALREPMEKGVIHLTRHGARQKFPAKSLVLATTNLCPCGNFQPGSTYKCRCSSRKLRNYVEKLTGPFLDRFAVFHIYEKPSLDLHTNILDIQKQVREARLFQTTKRQQIKINQDLTIQELTIELSEDVPAHCIPFSKSLRRRQSLLRVARTLADLDQSQKIKQNHLEEAQYWTSADIYRMERFRMDDFAMR